MKRFVLLVLVIVGTLAQVPAHAQRLRTYSPGSGEPTVLIGTDPAAGAEISQTVPAGVVWRLTSIRFALTTDATVANRLPVLTFDDGTNVYFTSLANAAQAASLGVNYEASASGISVSVSGQQQMILPVQGIVMLPGWRVRTVTTAIVAGDNYGAPALYFETYRR